MVKIFTIFHIMGMCIKDLRSRVRSIAENLINSGFSMTDILSIGLLFLEGKSLNEIGELRKTVNELATQEENEKSEQLKIEKIDIEQSIENVKYFVKFKLPSPEERKKLSELRKTLGSVPKKRKERRKTRSV